MRWSCVLICLVAGCFESNSSRCSDGTICPAGLVCATGALRCVLPEQVSACGTLEDNVPCTYVGATGTCRGGVCVPIGCGDQVANGDEACDGDDLRGLDCTLAGYHDGGELACAADCTLDASGCRGGICGDGEVNGNETCEPNVSAAADCRDFDFYDPGVAACNAGCRYDVSACTGFCGDGMLNGEESCEANVSLLETCVSFGFNYGWAECRACVPNIGDCHDLGWRAATIEQIGTVRALHGTGPTDIWAAGDSGLLMHRTGTRFVAVTPLVSESFTAVWAFATDDVFLAGSGGTIQRWNGSAWSMTFSDATWSFDALWSAGPGHLVAAGSQGLLAWNGTTWTPLAKPPGSQIPRKLWGATATDYYVIDSNEELYRFQAGTWTKLTLTGVRAIAGRATDDVYVALAGSGQHYNGISWQPLISMASPRAISCDSVGVHFVADAGMDYYYDGVGWGVYNNPTIGMGDLLAAYSPALGQVIAGGPNGLFRYDGSTQFLDPYPGVTPPSAVRGLWMGSQTFGFSAAGDLYQYNGATFTESQTNTNSRSVWGVAGTPNIAFAVGDAGSIYRYNGNIWQKQNEPMGTSHLYGVHGTSTSDVWAVGAGGVIIHYNGSNWSTFTSNTTIDLLAVWAASQTDAVAVGGNGTIVRWNGANWQVVPPVTTLHLRSVWGFAGNDIVAVGDGGTVLRWNGAAWTAMASGTALALRGVWGSAPDDLFVVGDLVSVLHHDGLGFTPVKLVGNATTSAFYSVTGFGRQVHFGGAPGPWIGMEIDRAVKWKRRSP